MLASSIVRVIGFILFGIGVSYLVMLVIFGATLFMMRLCFVSLMMWLVFMLSIIVFGCIMFVVISPVLSVAVIMMFFECTIWVRLWVLVW